MRFLNATSRRLARPTLELLEGRLAPAVHIWTGAASDLWSDDANWDGGSPAGDSKAELVFPRGSQNRTNVNDLSDLGIQSIHFEAYVHYIISGNSLTLAGGLITVDTNYPLTHVLSCNLILEADLIVRVDFDGFYPGALALSGRISGPHGLTKLGQGRLELRGGNTYSGDTLLQEGNVRVSGDNPFGTGMLTFDGGRVEPRGAWIANPFTVAPSRQMSIVGEGSLRFTGPGFLSAGSEISLFARDSITFTGDLSGNGSLRWATDFQSHLILGGANTYTGSTSISGGTLRLASDTALPTTTALTLGGILNLNGFHAVVGSLAGSGGVAMTTGSLTVGNDNTSTTYSGVISGQGSVTKVGVGTWTLSGNSTFTGGLTVAEGGVRLTGPRAAGAGALDILGGGTLEVAANVTLPGPVTNAGAVLLSLDRTFQAASYEQSAGGATSLQGGILNMEGGVFIGEGSTLEGPGGIWGDLVNAGWLDPGGYGIGNPLVVHGNFTQTETGTLHIEIGFHRDSNFDQLGVTGTVTLAGSLEIELLPDFVGVADDEYNVFEWAGDRVGDFDSVSLPDAGEFYLELEVRSHAFQLHVRRS